MASGGDGLHQEISGGTQRNVVFAQVVENVSLHGDGDLHAGHGAGRPGARRSPGVAVLPYAVGLLGVFLLIARPELPLPARLDPGPVVGGGLLLAGTIGLSTWSWLRGKWAYRRRAAWRTRRTLDRAAEALAESLVVRYDEDERLRRLNDPHPLDVAWTTLPPPGEGSGEEEAPSARPGPPDIADYYTATPARRLVVLGGAGAGKSVLVLRLAHGLLHRRTRGSGDPVPLIVSLASWDPDQGLLRWMAEQLADAHPEACTPAPDVPPTEVAFHLLLTGRVLPVLDGFDELPEHRRPAALRQIGETMRGRRPFVLASREPEYRRHVLDQLDLERTEIHLRPLGEATVRAYLSPGRAPTRWTPVLDRIADRSPAAPPEVRRLRQVLSVPLMVGLARVAYARVGADPSELLESDVFRSRADIESHLYDAFLDAVYSSSYDIQTAHGGWSPHQARTWIGFLAAHMEAVNEQDFAWWRLDRTLPRFASVLVMLPALVVGWLSVAVVAFGMPWWRQWLPLPSLAGAYAVLCGLALLAEAAERTTGRQEPPRRLRRPGRGDLRGAFTSWPERGLGVLAVLTIGATVTAVVRRDGSSFLYLWLSGVVVWWYGRRALRHVWRGADPARADSPAALLRADRRSVITVGWFSPLRLTDDATPLRHVLALPPMLLFAWQSVGGGRDVVTVGDWTLMAVATPVFWLLFAFGSSAWGGFTMARLYFWATGRLPRRLLPFLEDAHARGVLRQAGGVYRFRHIELRNRLALRVPSEVRARPRSAPGRVRRAVAAGLAVAVAGGQLAVGSGAVVAERLPGPVRSLPTACALLDAADAARLMRDPARVAADDAASCSVGEQAPFSRNVTIGISRILLTGNGVTVSGSEMAQVRYGQLRAGAPNAGERGVSDDGFHRDLRGLGHEAYVAAWSRSADTTARLERSRTVARVGVRVANAVVQVDYSEEFASFDRAAEVAQVLARQALRRAGLDGTRPRDGDPKPLSRGATEPAVDGPLSSVTPQSALPATENRFAFYNRRATGSVYGATWQDDERSYIWELAFAPFVFRAPKHMDCHQNGSYTRSAYTCTAVPDLVEAGLLPDLRLEIRNLRCGVNCSDRQTAAYLRSAPDHATTPWTKHNEATYYAAGVVGDGRYRMTMQRFWAWQNKTERTQQAYLLWVRVEVPSTHRALAQKIVNDMYAQTGAGDIVQLG
ncbi:NACHT domain-containing protein [Streptomyces sp. T12]|uniref:NACHT domain-containing protein n=1 Tax=Streptomyces sp. T12 TaxID=477697 RepID=UPI0011ACEB8F|nr:NACHT domain-containing protein [Streptomyces sp. T12]TWD18101.1 NACHT domain-containing protein [Streptomyces sp. T12]